MTYEKPFCIRISKESREKLDLLAKEKGNRKMSELVREILESYLREKITA